MQTAELGPLTVSRLALGTMLMGDDTPTEEAYRLLDRFVEAGGTLVDTADTYGDGRSERVLAPWLAEHRDEVIVATKVRFGVSDADSHMRISRELPAVTEEGAPPLVERFLRAHGLARAGVDHWVVHPGGRGIIEAVQRGLGLADEQVAPSFRVLSEFGNVGTPASFFVLAETVAERRPAPGDLGLMITIGPGVTVGLMLLAW